MRNNNFDPEEDYNDYEYEIEDYEDYNHDGGGAGCSICGAGPGGGCDYFDPSECPRSR